MNENECKNFESFLRNVAKTIEIAKLMRQFGKDALRIEYYDNNAKFSYPLSWDLGVTSDEILTN